MSASERASVERWRRPYDSFADVGRTQPFGSGASVIFNHRDLRLLNTTALTFQIRMWLSPTHLHGAMNADAPLPAAIRVEEREHAIRPHPLGGYSRHNSLWRIQGERESLLVRNNARMLYSPTLPSPSTP